MRQAIAIAFRLCNCKAQSQGFPATRAAFSVFESQKAVASASVCQSRHTKCQSQPTSVGSALNNRTTVWGRSGNGNRRQTCDFSALRVALQGSHCSQQRESVVLYVGLIFFMCRCQEKGLRDRPLLKIPYPVGSQHPSPKKRNTCSFLSLSLSLYMSLSMSLSLSLSLYVSLSLSLYVSLSLSLTLDRKVVWLTSHHVMPKALAFLGGFNRCAPIGPQGVFHGFLKTSRLSSTIRPKFL